MLQLGRALPCGANVHIPSWLLPRWLPRSDLRACLPRRCRGRPRLRPRTFA